MNIANIEVSGVQAAVREIVVIPAGIAGASVSFSFTDPRWDALTKTAVFQGCVTRDVVMDGDTVIIPHETVAEAGSELRVGIYGVDADKNLAIPTLWATIGSICSGADPSGDPSVDPTLPVWAELENRVEEMEDSLEEQIFDGIEEYLQSHNIGGEGDAPRGAVYSVNHVLPDLIGNVNVSAEMIHALPVAGGAMTGALNMNGQKITGLTAPASADEPATKEYVDASVPRSTSANNGQILTVVNGKAVWKTVDVWAGGSF